MIANNLTNWLLPNTAFKDLYNQLLVDSVSQQIGGSFIKDQKYSGVIKWPYLIQCASIFAASNDNKAHECALRIAQHVLSSKETSSLQKDCAVIILEKLSNPLAISLAMQRNHVEPDIEARLPVISLMNWTKNRLNSEIVFNDGDKLFGNRFQNELWRALEENDCTSSSAPTAAGKSHLIKMWVINLIKSSKTKLNIAFVVPTRALISEFERDLQASLKGMGAFVNITSAPLPSSILEEKTNIFVLTQERLQIYINENKIDQKIDVLVVDEAQKFNDRNRGCLLHQVIERVAEQSPNTKLVFIAPLTANPEVLIEEFAASRKTKSFKSEEATVNQNLIWCTPRKRLPRSWNIKLAHKGELLDIGTLTLSSQTTKGKKLPLIAYEIGKGTSGNIVYVNTASYAEEIAQKISLFQDPVEEDLDEEIEDLISLVKETIHESYILATTLRHQVAFHYGNMPDIVRSEIERLFSAGKIKFLVCTSTLVEGVNTSCKNIFLENPKKGSEAMSHDDLWNLAGRAGRWGKEFQGNIFCIDPESWDGESPPKERSQFLIDKSAYKALSNVDKLISFIQDHNLPDDNRLFEHSFSYLYAQFKQKGSLLNTAWAKKFDQNNLALLDDVLLSVDKMLSIPHEIILRNPGISPKFINNLYLKFSEHISANRKTIEDLIPPFHTEKDATLFYQGLFFELATLFGVPQLGMTEKHAWGNAIVTTLWMEGKPLSFMIKKRIRNNQRRDKVQEINTVIRTVMKQVEEIARFYAPKYLSCYKDVLEQYLKENKHDEYAANLQNFGMLLEYGLATTTQVSLASLGLSRTSALEISELMKHDDLTREDCLKWLKEKDLQAYLISSVIKKEINRVLDFYTELKSPLID